MIRVPNFDPYPLHHCKLQFWLTKWSLWSLFAHGSSSAWGKIGSGIVSANSPTGHPDCFSRCQESNLSSGQEGAMGIHIAYSMGSRSYDLNFPVEKQVTNGALKNSRRSPWGHLGHDQYHRLHLLCSNLWQCGLQAGIRYAQRLER